MEPRRPFQLSYTKLAAYDLCRKKYWFGYVFDGPKMPREDSLPGIVGNAVHRAMKMLADTGEPADGRSELDTYLKMPSHEGAAPGTSYYDDAVALYESGIAAHQSINSVKRWPELETWVPWLARNMAVQARIDRVDYLGDDRWQIIDWKTGKFDYGEVTDAQLDIAHLGLRLVRKLPPHATVRAIGWNLRTGDQRIRELDRTSAAGTLRYLARRAEQLQATTEFEATPSRSCSFCDYRSMCPDAAALDTAIDEWIEREPELFGEEPE